MGTTIQSGCVQATVDGDAFGGTFSVKVELVAPAGATAPLAFDCAGVSIPLALPNASVTVTGKLAPIGQTTQLVTPHLGPPVPYIKPELPSGSLPVWGWYENHKGDYVQPQTVPFRVALGKTCPGEWEQEWVPPVKVAGKTVTAGFWRNTTTWRADTWKDAPTTTTTIWLPDLTPRVDALQVQVAATSGSPDLDAFCRELLEAFGEEPADLVARVAQLGQDAWAQVRDRVDQVWEQFVSGFDLSWNLAQYLPAGTNLRQLVRDAAAGALASLRTKLEQLLRDTLGQVLAHLQGFCKRLWETPALREGAGPVLLAAAALLLVFLLGPLAIVVLLAGICVVMLVQQPGQAQQWLGLLEKLLGVAISLGQGVADLLRQALALLFVELAKAGQVWQQVRAQVGALFERLATKLRQQASFDLATWLKALAQQVAAAVKNAGLLAQLAPLTPPGAGALGPEPGKKQLAAGQAAPPPAQQATGASAAAGGKAVAGAQQAGGAAPPGAAPTSTPAAAAGGKAITSAGATGSQAAGGALQQSSLGAAAGGKQLGATAGGAALAGAGGPGKGGASGGAVRGAHGALDGRFTSDRALAIGALTLPADAAAALELAEVSPVGQVCGDLVVIVSQGMQDPWAFAGWVLDVFVQAFRQAGADLGHLLKPLFVAIREVGPITAEQFFDLVNPLPELALRAVADWVYRAWEWVKTAIVQAAWEAILEWLALLLGIVSEAVQALLDELAELRELLQWAGSLPGTLLRPADLFDVAGYRDDVLAIFRRKGGVTGWLAERSAQANVPMAALAKQLVRENPLARTVEQLGEHVRSLLTVVGGPVTEQDPVAQLRELQRRANALAAQAEKVWTLVSDQAAAQGPFVVEAKVEGIVTDPAQVNAGAIVDAGTDLFQQVASGEGVSLGGLGLGVSVLALRARPGVLELPVPDGVRRIWPEDVGDGAYFAREFPLGFPLPWEGGVALAYKPKLYVVDMRYHVAYGPDFQLKLLADPGAGHVGGGAGGPVGRLEAELQKPEAERDAGLDVDRDGKVTAADLALAKAQQRYYVNGVMWREVEAPVGFLASLTPWDWVFATVIPLGRAPAGAPPLAFALDESVEGQFERLGVLSVLSGQVTIPVIDYRIRYQYEGRYFLDLFTAFDLRDYLGKPAQEQLQFPIPMALTPGTRHDLIVRGGDTGRDWQAHLTTEPLNPMLRTWTVKGTVFLKGLLSYAGVAQYSQAFVGVQPEADLKITAIYKTKAPLIAVLSQWHGRLSHLAQNPPQLPTELPVPWGMIKAILEYSHLPQLCRALIGATGPFMDLCFEWVDQRKHLRAAIGWMRQSVLSRWTPAPSWHELRLEVSRWPSAEVGGAGWRDAVVAGLDEARDLLALSAGVDPDDEDPVYAPDLVADVCRRRVLARYEELVAAAPPVPDDPGAAPPSEGGDTQLGEGPAEPGAGGAGAAAKPAGAAAGPAAVRPTAARAPGALAGSAGAGTLGVAPGAAATATTTATTKTTPAADAAAGRALVEQRLDATFKDRARFAAGPDQLAQRRALVHEPVGSDDPVERGWALVQALEDGDLKQLEGRPATIVEPILPLELPQGTRVGVPGCGTYKLRRPYMIAFPVQRKDVDAVKAENDELVADELSWVRGNPFYKPLYHALLEIGREVQLYTVPKRATRYLLHVVGEGEPVVVESSVVLEDAAGNVWLWVRNRAFRYGWMCVDKVVWDAVFKRPEGAAAGLAQQVACNLLDPDKVALAFEVAEATGVVRRPLKRLEPSPRETYDDTRYAPLMRRLLARRAGLAATGDDELPLDLLSASLGAAFDDEDEAAAVDLWYSVLQEMNIRILGFPAADKAAEDGLQAEELARLGEVFAALDPRVREKLWSSTTAWLRTFCYLPFIGMHIINHVMHPIIEGDWELALDNAEDALRDMADFSPMELLLAVQSAAPYLLEAVTQVVAIGQKVVKAYKALDKAADMATGETTEAKAEGELGGTKASGWADWSTGSGKAEAHGTLDIVSTKGDDPNKPEWDDLGMMMLRLFVDDQAAPGKPAPKKGDPKHDWGIKFDAKASVKNLWGGGPGGGAAAPGGATELTLRLGYPQVDKVSHTVSRDETLGPGDQAWLEVFRWKVVGPGIEGDAGDVDGSRVPPEVQALVTWVYAQAEDAPADDAFRPLRAPGGVARPGAPDDDALPQAKGAKVKLEVPEGVDAGTLWFKARVPDAEVAALVDAGAFDDFKGGPTRAGRAGYFPWDKVEFQVEASEGARYDVLVGGQLVLSVPLAQGAGEGGGLLLGQPLTDGSRLGPARSPVKVVFTNAKAHAEAPAGKPDKPKSGKKGPETEGELKLDFGKDSLLITWQTEAKGGAGAGDEAGAGASGGATTGPRFSMPTVELPMHMLQSEQSLAILVRFFCRFFYHETEALYHAVRWLQQQEVDSTDTAECAEAGLGFGFWTLVYSAFALKETIFDLMHDHAQWIAQLLQGVKFIAKVDWAGKVGLTVLGKAEATAEVHGVLEIPLGTVLWPVIDVLLAADTTQRTGPTLKDLIEPCLEAKLEDAFTIKVGGPPLLFEVESKGTLATGKVHIPPDSPLMAKLEGISSGMAKAAEQWKARRQGPDAPKVEDAHVALKLLRMTLDMLYHETQALLVDRSPDKAWKAASPVVIELMNRFTEGVSPPQDVPPQDEVRPSVEQLRQRIAALGLHGEPLEPGQVVVVETTVATGKRKVWLYVGQAELQALLGGWLPPEAPQEVYETVTRAVTLPQAPAAVGWHTFEDPDAGKTWTGVVAGFASAGAAQAFAGARPGAWVDAAVAGTTWSRADGAQELHWAWVETKLVPALDAAQRDLPHLEHAEGTLRLTFTKEPVGAIGPSTAPVLAQSQVHARTPISRVVLVTDANLDEQRLLVNAVQANQPAPPPTPAPPPPAGADGAGAGGQQPDVWVHDPRLPKDASHRMRPVWLEWGAAGGPQAPRGRRGSGAQVAGGNGAGKPGVGGKGRTAGGPAKGGPAKGGPAKGGPAKGGKAPKAGPPSVGGPKAKSATTGGLKPGAGIAPAGPTKTGPGGVGPATGPGGGGKPPGAPGQPGAGPGKLPGKG